MIEGDNVLIILWPNINSWWSLNGGWAGAGGGSILLSLVSATFVYAPQYQKALKQPEDFLETFQAHINLT